MKGKVIGFDSRTGTGAIEGEDGLRYEFSGTEWRSVIRPEAGVLVDFNPEGHLAQAIFPIQAPATARGGGDFSWWAFYVSFRGRTTRKPYWLYLILPVFVISILLTLLDVGLGTYDAETGGGLFSGLFSLIAIWPSLAIGARRCHDRGRSGWFQLIMLIPLIGWIWLLVEIGFLRGTRGPNRFGPDPLEGRA